MRGQERRKNDDGESDGWDKRDGRMMRGRVKEETREKEE